ncbi:MAG: GH92 family glycosyl hydrolase [Lachnospiraceae bacterium]|nr:GH92 family glycosyl hydrolase [Lachnospiraceae bacterium]
MKLHEYVDTIVGAVADIPQDVSFPAGGGKTYPGAVVPWGAVQFSPDTITGGDNSPGYSYHHTTIEGFSINHLSGIGWYGDLGNFQIMPVVGEVPFHSGTNMHSRYQPKRAGRESEFSHDSEITKPGYYAVTLLRYDTRVETTATCHAGIMRVTFPRTENAGVYVDLARRIGGYSEWQQIFVRDENTIEGSIYCPDTAGGWGHGDGHVTYTLHFCAQFSRPLEKWGVWENGERIGKLSQYQGKNSGFYARYDAREDQELLIRVGISYVSTENARENLAQECTHWSFEGYVEAAQKKWEKQLSVISVQGSLKNLQKFYTCLYHASLDPRIFVDCNGEYPAGGKTVNKTNDFLCRTVFSGWDVYRSEFPLLTLIDPEAVNDMIATMIELAKEGNTTFPRWELLGLETGCMVGDPGAIITADAYLKGIKNYDVQKAWEICRDTVYSERSNRNNREAMQRYGYVPGNISQTVENAFADWCIARLGEKLGYREEADKIRQQSLGYRQIFDTDFGWMRRKDADGNWMEHNGIYDERGCVESNIFQQSWFAPHDIPKLIEMMGGNDAFCEKLERFMEGADLSALWNDDYNHSNEPCHTVVHLFNHAGCPWRAQYWVRRIQNEAYHEGPFGFCGNEDVGQMSAWLVLTALGFHSTTAASNHFDFNTPLFARQELDLNPKYHSCSIDKKLIIETDCDPEENWYIRGVWLNKKELNRTFITYEELTAGGVLHFALQKEPCYEWARTD